jgi:hypothetical protein
MSGASDEPERKASFKEIMQKAGASAMRGGTAGAVAMGANVACLMVRTCVCVCVCVCMCVCVYVCVCVCVCV